MPVTVAVAAGEREREKKKRGDKMSGPSTVVVDLSPPEIVLPEIVSVLVVSLIRYYRELGDMI